MCRLHSSRGEDSFSFAYQYRRSRSPCGRWGKCSYTECSVHITGSMAAKLVAFPLVMQVSNTCWLTPFGGPEYSTKAGESFAPWGLQWIHCFISASLSNFSIELGVKLWKVSLLDQASLTTMAIQYLIRVLNVTGPGMNAMLATSWAVICGWIYSVELCIAFLLFCFRLFKWKHNMVEYW